MANYCSNTISVSGEDKDISLFYDDIEEMLERQNKRKGEGVVPLGLNEESEEFDKRWAFDIYIDRGNYFTCESKWVEIASIVEFLSKKHHKLTVIHEFEEMANELFGYSKYTDGKLVKRFTLDDSDFDLEYNEDGEASILLEPVESESEYYEDKLKEKIKRLS